VIKIRWPVAIAGLFFSLLAWFVFYTQSIVDTLQEESETITSLFAIVQEGIIDQDPDGWDRTLFNLQQRVIQSGIPLVVVDGDSVIQVQNEPFEFDLSDPKSQRQLLNFVEGLAQTHPPIAGAVEGQFIYFGDTPEVRRLGLQRWFLASGLLITTAIGFLVIRHQRRSESEKAWTAMARELAHQLGTPISSLQGWLELMRLPEDERPGSLDQNEVTDGIEEDLIRLERISRRFELVGRDPKLAPLQLREVVRDLETYLQARLPRLNKGVLLVVDIPGNLPDVMAHQVLLNWALENIVKNALDAMAGKGGEIRIKARHGSPGFLNLLIQDTGPGVPLELRDRIFEPGVSGKSHGWGVGLTLSRRIIEGAHHGRIALLEGPERGATFEIRIPTART
jgi:signal transduction histidine kinase